MATNKKVAAAKKAATKKPAAAKKVATKKAAAPAKKAASKKAAAPAKPAHEIPGLLTPVLSCHPAMDNMQAVERELNMLMHEYVDTFVTGTSLNDIKVFDPFFTAYHKSLGKLSKKKKEAAYTQFVKSMPAVHEFLKRFEAETYRGLGYAEPVAGDKINQAAEQFPDAVGEELLNAIGSGMKFSIDGRPGVFQFIPANPDGDKTDAIYRNGGFYAECTVGVEYLVIYSIDDGFKWNTQVHNTHLHLVPDPPPPPEEPAQ